jgi:hypothetical protein
MAKSKRSARMTKARIMECLNEIGWRFVRTEDADPEHYKALGVAFGVANYLVGAIPAEDIENVASAIIECGLEGGSTQG